MIEFNPFDLSEPRKRAEFFIGWRWFVVFFGTIVLFSFLIFPLVFPNKKWFELPILPVVGSCFGGWFIGRKAMKDQSASNAVVPEEYRGAFDGLELREKKISAVCSQPSSSYPSVVQFLPRMMGSMILVPKEFLESVSTDSVKWSLELEQRVAKRFEVVAGAVLGALLFIGIVALLFASLGFFRILSCSVGSVAFFVLSGVLLTARSRIEKSLARTEDRAFAEQVLQFAYDRAVALNSVSRLSTVDEGAIMRSAKAYGIELKDRKVAT